MKNPISHDILLKRAANAPHRSVHSSSSAPAERALANRQFNLGNISYANDHNDSSLALMTIVGYDPGIYSQCILPKLVYCATVANIISLAKVQSPSDTQRVVFLGSAA